MLSRHGVFSRSVIPAPRLARTDKAPKISHLPSLDDCNSMAWSNKRVAPAQVRSPVRAMCALGFSARELSDLRRVVGDAGPLLSSVQPVPELIVNRAQFEQSTHAIVNLDAFEAVEDAVDWLLNFRLTVPECIVVAVSSFVSGDDLGSERRAICDATLRWPISKHRFDAGLRAAEEATDRDFAPCSARSSSS